MQLLGAEVALDGAHVLHEVTAKLAKWPTCKNPTKVQGFLGTVSQLAMGCVTCHACHGCVTDFRPILGNPVEVTHVTSLGHVYIFPH